MIMTYSFPCQDLSLAGIGKGMERDSNTRSSLLWQVERIILELKQLNQLPDILLMENVPQVIGEKNIHNYKKWENVLSSLGYESYTKVLNASDYEIPQHRERCFMVSIKTENSYYTFPKPIKLETTLNDFLEENVDEKYFLSKEKIEIMKRWNSQEKPVVANSDNPNCSATLTTRPDTLGVVVNKPLLVGGIGEKDSNNGKQYKNQNRVYSSETSSSAIATGYLPNYETTLGIRKLTPRECFRLMGLYDSEIDKIINLFSNAILYHLAGDSIVVQVLENIFKQML